MNSTGADKPLTQKQASFALLVASGVHPIDAYIKAYNSAGNRNTAKGEAARILKVPRVRSYVDRLKEDAAAALAKTVKDELHLDRSYVLRNLKEVVERCMEAAPVKDRSGKPVAGAFQFDAKGANQALMLIGKELGMFVERREIRHGPLVDATDEELDKEIATIATELASLTGKPLRQVLLESVKMELAIDVTPKVDGEIAAPGEPREDGDGDPGGAVSRAGGAPVLVYPRSRPAPVAGPHLCDAQEEVAGGG